MPNPQEILALKRFCQEITYRPRSLDSQPTERQDKALWCEDWLFIEMLKYWFLGESTYFAEAPPRRLRNNPLWSKDAVKASAEAIWADFSGNVNEIISYLRKARS